MFPTDVQYNPNDSVQAEEYARLRQWASNIDPVSYTHLDVYKRQAENCGGKVKIRKKAKEDER